MKKIVLLLITVFCMCCMVACGGEAKEDASAGGSNEVVDNSTDDEPVVTAEPTVEVTPAPTEEPTTEATPAPTEEPTPAPTENPYPGIDMESDLPGEEWIQTFNGVIEEPKVVVFNNETGRKQIIEPEEKVLIAHESDVIAVHLPEGYVPSGVQSGIYETDSLAGESFRIYYLDFDKMTEKKFRTGAVELNHGDETIRIEFVIQTQE